MDQFITILLLILAVVVILAILKFAAQLGIRILTCGCLVIIVAAVVLILMGVVELPPIESF